MLLPWDKSFTVASINLLSGGYRNTNYAVVSKCNRKVVLRLCQGDIEAFGKEYALLNYLKGMPVPLPLFFDKGHATPYAIHSFIEGDSLENVSSQLTAAELASLNYQIG